MAHQWQSVRMAKQSLYVQHVSESQLLEGEISRGG